MFKTLALCGLSAIALVATPALAQQTITVTGAQSTARGQNARLDCGQVRLPRPGAIIAVKTNGTNGFWINRGSMRAAQFPGNPQGAVGYTLRANDTYWICPDAATRGGSSSVQVIIRY